MEDRTTKFGVAVVKLCRQLPRDSINNRLTGQIVGSSGSVGANYREANDALGKKDFLLRLKIARKEAKETLHWFELLEEANPNFYKEIQMLKAETEELKNILSSIIIRSTPLPANPLSHIPHLSFPLLISHLIPSPFVSCILFLVS